MVGWVLDYLRMEGALVGFLVDGWMVGFGHFLGMVGWWQKPRGHRLWLMPRSAQRRGQSVLLSAWGSGVVGKALVWATDFGSWSAFGCFFSGWVLKKLGRTACSQPCWARWSLPTPRVGSAKAWARETQLLRLKRQTGGLASGKNIRSSLERLL